MPGAFGEDAVLFGFAFLLVRVLHLVLYAHVSRNDPDLLAALSPVAPAELPRLLCCSFSLASSRATCALRYGCSRLAIDYMGPAVIALWRGWRIAPKHFAERHGLIILIALGESIIAIGVGAGLDLDDGE